MAEETNAPVQVEEPQVQQVTTEVESSSYRETIKQLLVAGARKVSKIRVKNVTVVDMDGWVRVGITIIPPVKGYNANGEEVETNTIFVSLFALVACLRENEEFAWVGNALLERPNILPLILCGSDIDILQRHYAAGEEIYNPFSKNPDQVPSVYDHNVYINDVIDVRLGKTGEKMLDKLADKLMGF